MASGQKWVTINGHHVLINANGEPVREEDRKLLAGNKKSETKKKWTPTANDNSVTDAKTSKELDDKLAAKGLKLDSAYKNASNDEKVYMYDDDGNTYEGTYNKYSDGGREIVSIKKADKETASRLKGNELRVTTKRKGKNGVEEVKTEPFKHTGKKYSDEEKKDLFNRMNEYNKKKYNYESPYSHKSYTDETYEEWEHFLNKHEGKKEKQEPLGNKGTSVGAGEMYDRLHPSTNKTDRGLKSPSKTVSLEEKKKYIKDNNLTQYVREFNRDGNNTNAAIDYVYDQHNLSEVDFKKKYGITEAIEKTKSAVNKNNDLYVKTKKGRMADADLERREEDNHRPEYGTSGKKDKNKRKKK